VRAKYYKLKGIFYITNVINSAHNENLKNFWIDYFMYYIKMHIVYAVYHTTRIMSEILLNSEVGNNNTVFTLNKPYQSNLYW
jgi:hypothetical protein